ncbi:MAG: glycosyltransferase family 4 protein [Planctomycetes bacterium]|nr:glycosyltransferase family 4 protein [Planctomycetota bacterium]
MRVVINRTLTLGRKTGIGHYTAELLRALKQLTAAGQVIGFPAGWFWVVGQALSRPVLAGGESGGSDNNTSLLGALKKKCSGVVRRAGQAYLRHALRSCLRKHECNLYHEPNTIPLPCDVPAIATIHDLSVILHPHWHPAGRVAHFEKNLHRLTGAAHFITVSEFTRQEAIRTFNLRPEKVTRIHLGSRMGLTPMLPAATATRLAELRLPPRFLLYVGTIEPRKNLLLLMRAYGALPRSWRDRYPLVLAGSWGWSSGPVAEYFNDRGRHEGVIHLGYVSDLDLPALYSGARALVYPSIYEGFGLPPLEMMACGGPVLASTAGAVAEIVGRRAHLIAPDDEDGWRLAMQRVIEDDDWHASLCRGVRDLARSFTWERCAAETLHVYRMLAGEVPRKQAA